VLRARHDDPAGRLRGRLPARRLRLPRRGGPPRPPAGHAAVPPRVFHRGEPGIAPLLPPAQRRARGDAVGNGLREPCDFSPVPARRRTRRGAPEGNAGTGPAADCDARAGGSTPEVPDLAGRDGRGGDGHRRLRTAERGWYLRGRRPSSPRYGRAMNDSASTCATEPKTPTPFSTFEITSGISPGESVEGLN